MYTSLVKSCRISDTINWNEKYSFFYYKVSDINGNKLQNVVLETVSTNKTLVQKITQKMFNFNNKKNPRKIKTTSNFTSV